MLFLVFILRLIIFRPATGCSGHLTHGFLSAWAWQGCSSAADQYKLFPTGDNTLRAPVLATPRGGNRPACLAPARAQPLPAPWTLPRQTLPFPPATPSALTLFLPFSHFLLLFEIDSCQVNPRQGHWPISSRADGEGGQAVLAWLVPRCPHQPSDGDGVGRTPPATPDPPICHLATMGRESPGAGNDGHDGTWRASSATPQGDGEGDPISCNAFTHCCPCTLGSSLPFPLTATCQGPHGDSKPQPPAPSPFPTLGRSSGYGRGTVTPTGM